MDRAGPYSLAILVPMEYVETDTEEEFVRRAVEVIVVRIEKALRERDSCILGLSGSSTPRPVYEALGKDRRVDWSKVHLFLVDERYVPPDDKRSNAHMICSTLLANAPIRASQLHFPDTTLPLEECVQQYAGDLHGLFRSQRHLPDLLTLGLGEDGHIASLFPPLAPHLMDDTRLVAHTTTPSSGSGQAPQFDVHDRITLALNPIAAAGSHVFLLRAKEKKRVWEEMLASSEGDTCWPAKRILEQPDVVVVWGP